MKVIILGSGKQAISVAKSCLLIAKSILVYDKNDAFLMAVKKEFEKNVENSNHKLEYTCKPHFDTSEKYIVFDCFTDCEQDIDNVRNLFKNLLDAEILFVTSKFYSVTYLASLSHNPKRVVGLQFLTSFDDIKIVELIRGMHTSQKILKKAEDYLNKMGKDSIIIKDTPGFLLNRMTLIFINEAIHLLDEGIGTPDEIDSEMEQSLGMTIGPLKLADKMGLDVILKMLNTLYEETGNPKLIPNPLLQKMVHAGYLGVESKAGFFNYSAEILKFPYLNYDK